MKKVVVECLCPGYGWVCGVLNFGRRDRRNGRNGREREREVANLLATTTTSFLWIVGEKLETPMGQSEGCLAATSELAD